jgi:hypothetical protein
MPLPQGLPTRYEQLREQVLCGAGRLCMGMSVVLRQGLWAWMMLAAAEDAHGVTRCQAASQSPDPSFPLATVPRELLAAWTDLVVGMVARQEGLA